MAHLNIFLNTFRVEGRAAVFRLWKFRGSGFGVCWFGAWGLGLGV